METRSVLAALSALSQEHRLGIFRLLVEHAPEGLPAGSIAARLSLAPATASFHLKELSHAGLIASRQDGRFVWYRADLEAMEWAGGLPHRELLPREFRLRCRVRACRCAPPDFRSSSHSAEAEVRMRRFRDARGVANPVRRITSHPTCRAQYERQRPDPQRPLSLHRQFRAQRHGRVGAAPRRGRSLQHLQGGQPTGSVNPWAIGRAVKPAACCAPGCCSR